MSSYTDTYGKVIRYEYDAVGNLPKIIYPDNTAVTYAYDANHNLIRVTDWANRVTSYTYDVNNRVVGVTKPDGSVTTTVYDNKQRVTSTVERTATGAVITGFEYTYDDLSRIIEEKVLANSTKMCYTYDNLSRVTARTVKKLSDNSVVSTETFNYDAAGNVTSAPDSSFQYDTNNRLISWGGNAVSYDLDGNMLSNGSLSCTYDSANRLVSAGGHTYTYNAEDVRIRNLCSDEDTTYTYNTNAKLSMLLMKTANGVVTKYVYGKGLIGEEVNNTFKTYHFDCRGSTIAITDASGNITDTFAYDTYGKLLTRTGTSKVIFGYNGRDGVVTDDNGLIYMRARYYSPEMKRFINADVVAGAISNAITLNRFAYANGNPVSFVDPFGLSAERGTDLANQIRVAQSNLGEYNGPFYILNAHKAILEAIGKANKTGKVNIDEKYNLFTTGNIDVYWKIKATLGEGDIDILDLTDKLESEDIVELANKFGLFDVKLMSKEGVIHVDDNTTLTFSRNINMSLLTVSPTMDITCTLKYMYDDENYVSSTIGVSGKIENNKFRFASEYAHVPSRTPLPVRKPSFSRNPVYGPVPNHESNLVTDSTSDSTHNASPSSEYKKDIDWEFVCKAGAAIGLTALAIGATAETFLTGGIGIWNDAPAWGAAFSSWATVFAH